MAEGVDVRQGPAATSKGTRNSVELVFEHMGWQVWRGLWKRMAGATVSGSSCPLRDWERGDWGLTGPVSSAPSSQTGISIEGSGDRWPLSLFLAGH